MGFSSADFGVYSDSADVVSLSIQFTDALGEPLLARSVVFGYLSGDEDGASTADGYSIEPFTVGDCSVFDLGDLNRFMIVSDNNGFANISFTHDAAKTAYLVLVFHNSITVISPAIVHEV